MPSIHTIDSRNHVMLEVLRDHFAWNNERTFKEIQLLHKDLVTVLANKGIDYTELRSALTPQASKHETAFLFNSELVSSNWYGKDLVEFFLSKLKSAANHCILTGDLDDPQDQLARKLIQSSAVAEIGLNFSHPCFVFVIYINNLNDKGTPQLHGALKEHPAYLGYVPCTFSSPTKSFISTCVGNRFIRYKQMVIMGHEDDVLHSEDRNILGYDFKSLGYTVKSIKSYYTGVFLSYKIERMFLEDTDADVEIGLSAISNTTTPLLDCHVVIEDNKFEQYLQVTSKGGILAKAGLAGLSKTELEIAIRKRLRSNYIYNLEWRDEADYKLSKLNIMLEFAREGGRAQRITVALAYRAEHRELRLVTITS
jgi:hypothetical protein